MAPRQGVKAERLMNLLICLLNARHYVPKEQLRRSLEPYRDLSAEAFEKMFERDKNELRELGIPIEVGNVQVGFDDEPGYRVRRANFELPALSFTAEEASILGLAARVWEHAGLAQAASTALVTLRAAGVDVEPAAVTVPPPRLPAAEPAFDPLWSAVVDRRVVGFAYRPTVAAAPARRTIEPWGVLHRAGRWYVVGYDRDRGAPRIFRMSRIEGVVTAESDPAAFDVPAGLDLAAEAARLEPSPPRERAHVRVRAGTCLALRRHGRLRAGADGWDVVELDFAEPAALAAEIAVHGSDAVAIDPPAVRDAVVALLRGARDANRAVTGPAAAEAPEAAATGGAG